MSANRVTIGHAVEVERACLKEDRGFDSECWVWPKAKAHGGYGIVRRDGRNLRTHVVTYESVNGAVPDGLELDHLCRVPACCNPDHLEAVSHTENVRRGGAAKITAEIARQIRASTESRASLAVRFGVSKRIIDNVRRGRTWSDPGAPSSPIFEPKGVKLTEVDVLAIRADPRPPSAVAEEYGVSKVTVWNIRTRRTWKEVA